MRRPYKVTFLGLHGWEYSVKVVAGSEGQAIDVARRVYGIFDICTKCQLMSIDGYELSDIPLPPKPVKLSAHDALSRLAELCDDVLHHLDEDLLERLHNVHLNKAVFELEHYLDYELPNVDC